MSWANEYVGKPYVSNGRGLDGFDCWGLVCLIYARQLGIQLPEYGAVDAADLLGVARSMDAEPAFGRWVRIAAPQPFAVVSMFGRAGQARRVVHVGVMVDERMMIHAQKKSHCAIERIDSPLIRSRIDGFWRHADAG